LNQRINALIIALVLGSGTAEAAPLTKEQAIAAATKICAKRISGEDIFWQALPQGADWFVTAWQPRGDSKPISVEVVIPADGPLPTDCRPRAVRITPQP
jgi:hypothetical protein